MTRQQRTIFALVAAMALAAIASGAWLARQEMTGAIAVAQSATRAQAAPATGGTLSARASTALRNASGAVWVRYETDAEKANRGMCGNYMGSGAAYDLDKPGGWYSNDDKENDPGSTRIAVYLQAEKGKFTRIQVFNTQCPVKASASGIRDLGAASADEGVAYLSSLMPAASTGEEKLAKNVVFAVALHRGPSADDELYGWASGNLSTKLRRDAAFWMGSARGERSFNRLVQLARGNGEQDFRKHAVFAISLNKSEKGTTELLRLAKEGTETEVRKAAIFWLSQRASKAAVEGLEQIVENEADTKLRQHAVFALSQLPDEEGVPKLIQLAKTHRDPGVRKKAIFWLSQKNDPRVLRFLEDVLVAKGGN